MSTLMGDIMRKSVQAIYDTLVGTHPYRKGGRFNNGVQFDDEFGDTYLIEIIITKVVK